MEYRNLGKAGVKVSALGMGGNEFGDTIDEKETERVVHYALDKGINFFDTNNVYSYGLSEEYLGKALKGRRHEAVVTTKFGSGSKNRIGKFGESLPEHALDMATLAAKKCDMFLVLGSSLVVYPAAHIPRIAKENGAILVIVNIDPTPLDDIADLVIHESASKVLSNLLGRNIKK